MHCNSISFQETNLTDFFNLEELGDLCYEDQDLLRSIIDEFIHCIPHYLLTLRESIECGNAIAVSNHACHLRGTTSLCAVYKVPKMCRVLEKQAKQGDLALAKSSYQKLEAHLTSMSDFYHVFF